MKTSCSKYLANVNKLYNLYCKSYLFIYFLNKRLPLDNKTCFFFITEVRTECWKGAVVRAASHPWKQTLTLSGCTSSSLPCLWILTWKSCWWILHIRLLSSAQVQSLVSSKTTVRARLSPMDEINDCSYHICEDNSRRHNHGWKRKKKIQPTVRYRPGWWRACQIKHESSE